METNSTSLRGSRYVSGGITEVNSTALEWWDREVFQSTDTDTVYTVPAKYAGRLDLITAVVVGEEHVAHWWVVAMINNILDPHTEIFEGRVLYIPTKERLASLINGRLGGVPSAREVPVSILPIV